jgi:hypothetical protein
MSVPASLNDVSAGTVMTLVIPLALLCIVLAWWGFVASRARRTHDKTRPGG